MLKNHQVTKTQNKTKWVITLLCIIAPFAVASLYIFMHDWPETILFFANIPFNPWDEVIWENLEIIIIPGLIVWGVMTIVYSKWLSENHSFLKKSIKGIIFLFIQVVLWISILVIHWVSFTATLSGGPVIGFPMFDFDTSFFVTIAIGIISSVLISVLYFKRKDG